MLCAAGVWTYTNRVLIPHQIHYAAEHGIPRGNFSDLYPRWLGARELFLHGRDPYSAEITRDAQAGFYGRPLDPDGPDQRNYQQGFYYPLYVAFGLAPTIHLPFEMVRKVFFWALLALTVITVPLWPHLLRWSVPVSVSVQASIVVFTVGSLPVVQGLKIQQITLLVMPMLAVAMLLLVSDRPIPAGILLACATIKPQIVSLLFLWLTIWTLAGWRRRYRWVVSFLISMAILCAASEFYLPHWIPRFLHALYEYRNYTGQMSVMDRLIGTPWSRVPELLAFAALMLACWRERREAASSAAFAFIVASVLATTVLLMPTYALYNQVLLIPALLILVKERRAIWQRSNVSRVLAVLTMGLVGWPWIACFGLAGLSFLLPSKIVEQGWTIPFWTVLQTPLAVATLMLVHYYQKSFTAPAGAGSS